MPAILPILYGIGAVAGAGWSASEIMERFRQGVREDLAMTMERIRMASQIAAIEGESQQQAFLGSGLDALEALRQPNEADVRASMPSPLMQNAQIAQIMGASMSELRRIAMRSSPSMVEIIGGMR